MNTRRELAWLFILALSAFAAGPLPRIGREGSKATLVVDGKPFIVLGAQVHNSSGWPSRVEALIPGAKTLHLNGDGTFFSANLAAQGAMLRFKPMAY